LIRQFGGKAIIGDEMGLGKTYQSLFWADENPQLRPILIICPQSLRQNWIDGAESVLGIRAVPLRGQTPGLCPKTPVLVINFEILCFWADALIEWGPQLIIIDECHRANNPSTATTQAVESICKSGCVESILALSGTPIKSAPAEFFTILNILVPDVFPSASEFYWEFCGPKLKPWGWEFKGATKTNKLHRLLTQHCLIRRMKDDELQLPRKSVRQILLPLRDPETYTFARDDFIAYLKTIDYARAAKAAKAKAMVRVGELKRLAAKLKARAAIGWLLDFAERRPSEKIIVFAWHHAMIAACERRIHPGKRVTYTGESSEAKKRRAELRFRRDPKCQFFLANISSAGVGLNLTEARYVFFLELPWVPNDVTQCIARAHRIGQTRDVRVGFLLGEGTIEESICKLLLTKQTAVTSVVDGADSVDEQTAIYREILEGLQKL
jgi:SWI/SNF-related matrix-associated actin-dependent regulator 1 of chromatin subfamily A